MVVSDVGLREGTLMMLPWWSMKLVVGGEDPPSHKGLAESLLFVYITLQKKTLSDQNPLPLYSHCIPSTYVL